MLPKTPYNPDNPQPHESINDLPTHPKSLQQLFVPVPESRVFTREDAAKAFDPDLKTPDERIPHPDLVAIARERNEGLSPAEIMAKQQERDLIAEERKVAKEARREQIIKKTVKVVPSADQGGIGGRWDWKFSDIKVSDAGKDGRGKKGVGARYGLPHEDRKRGQVKIPRSVPA
jgi:Eukaryotic mitochondrial regulator protein